jgi:hypothetical protein
VVLCVRCRVHKPESEFSRFSRKVNGLQSWCKTCAVAETRAWRARHRDKVLARRRANWKRKPQQERSCAECGIQFTTCRSTQRYCSRVCKVKVGKRTSRRVSIGSRARRRILDRDGWRCYLCTQQIDPSFVWPHPLSPSVDHVVPVSAGGSNRSDNLRATHWHCNEAKADSLPGTEVWIPLEAA